MIELSVKKIGHALFCDPLYEEDFDLLKVNQWYNAELTQPRNYRFHKKFFALIKACFEFQNRIDNMELLRKLLIVEAGYCDLFQYPDGRLLFLAESISFAKCDQTKFDKVYNDVWQVAMDKYCYKGTEKDIEKRVNVLMSFT